MRAISLTAAVILIVVVTIAAIESEWTGYAVSTIRRISGFEQASALSGPPDAVIRDAYRPETGKLTLLAAGDIVDCPERRGFASKLPMTARLLGLPSAFELQDVAASKTARLAQRWPEVPILAIGDLVYSAGSPVEFSDCYDPIWGDLRDRTLPAPGNHEYRTPHAFGYYDYWLDRAGPDRKGYYAVHAGDWLILSLNSEVDARPGSDQGRWLRETLHSAPEACVLAFYHKPAFSLQERDDRENAVLLFRQLQRSGATLVLNGHNHFYERTAPLGENGEVAATNGTIAFTVGTGGRTSGERPRIGTTDRAIFGSVGLLRLELDAGRFQWWYYDATVGEVADKGEAPCNPSRASHP